MSTSAAFGDALRKCGCNAGDCCYTIGRFEAEILGGGQMQRSFGLALLAAIMGVGTLPVKADTIAGNFGEPGDTYQTSTGTAWEIGGPINESRQCLSLSPWASRTSLLSSALADNWFAGTNSLPVGIYSGSDPTTATLFESFTLVASALQTAQIFTETSVLHPLLVGGQTY
jgi:hypothetical protein